MRKSIPEFVSTGARYPVQTVNSGSANSSTRVPVLGATPTNGNKLILVSLCESTNAISSVVTTNVTWSLLSQSTAGVAPVIEIWIGAVGASASATTTVTYGASSFHNAIVMEWTGLTGTLDNSSNNHSTTDAVGVHPVSILTPNSETALVVCGESTTSNGTNFTGFTGTYLMISVSAATCFVGYGFPGMNAVIGNAIGGASATASGCTVSIL